MSKIIGFCLVLSMASLWAQNLMKERLWKIDSRKKSIYMEGGIFHSGFKKNPGKVTKIRHSYSSSKGYERIVIDFNTSDIPKIYGFLSDKEAKLYLDLFDTGLSENVSFPGNSKFVKNVNFFPISKDSLSVEIKFRNAVTADIFYLQNPARLVIDLKK